MPIAVTQARPQDEPILWHMLYHAAHRAEDGATSPDAAKTDPYLSKYVAGWGKPTDLGVIAYDGDIAVDVVWSRLPIDENRTSFRVIGEISNHVGTRSYNMVIRFAEPT